MTKTRIKKHLALTTISVFLFSIATFAQDRPQLNVGWIFDVAALKSGKALTPLMLNDGNTTFLNQWAVLAEARIDQRFSIFAEIQSRGGLVVWLYGLSAVYQPFEKRSLHIEAGKFLIPFGNFLSRRWASENPLFEFPLAYNYQTNVSAFRLPRATAALLNARGNGYNLSYPDLVALDDPPSLYQSRAPHIPSVSDGLRVLSREVYLTGIQLFSLTDKVFYAISITNGAPSNPVDINTNSGVQAGARLRLTPMTGFDIGVSFSSAPYLNEASVDTELANLEVSAQDYRQTVAGFDLAFSRNHFEFFAEALFNRWETPFLSEGLDLWGGYVEGKYTLSSRVFLAGRWSFLIFERIPDPSDVDGDGDFQEPWDYDVNQFEFGFGYRVNRHALLKGVYQLNRMLNLPAGDPSDDLVALQAVVFF